MLLHDFMLLSDLVILKQSARIEILETMFSGLRGIFWGYSSEKIF